MQKLCCLLPATVAVCAILSMAQGETPDPDPSHVQPWDTYQRAFVTPGAAGDGGVGEVTVFALTVNGDPVENASVEIYFGPCVLCMDSQDPGLTGVTDENGECVLNPAIGGCDGCVVGVRANGITISTYTTIVSTDWDGHEANGVVGATDFAFFSTSLRATQNDCADHNGDGIVNGLDFSMFATSFKRGDANAGGCQ
jgi:hypothetical protein